MYNFILQLIVMVSLGAIIYLIARAVPRVTEIEAPSPRESYFDKLMQKLPLEKADAFASLLFEKFLRKLKVVILRLENIVEKYSRKLKPAESSGAVERQSLFESPENKQENQEE